MRPSSASRRAASPARTAFLVAGLLILGVIGTLGGLWAAGVDIPFLRSSPDYTGLVPVPMTARAVPAFTQITRDHLLDPKTGLPKYMYRDPDWVKRTGVIVDFTEIVGRVIGHDKQPSFPFRADDFLPKGTRPGIVAAIPPGKRAVTVDVSRIQGIHGLKVGDRLDLLASLPVDLQKVLPKGTTTGSAGVHLGILAQMKQAAVRVLVQNGVLVSAATTRVIPFSANSLTQGAVNRAKPVLEAVIAVDPTEIAPLAEAIAIEASLTCVARSGHPDDPGESSVTPHGTHPAEQVAPIERVIGGTREVFFVPKQSIEAAPAGKDAGAGFLKKGAMPPQRVKPDAGSQRPRPSASKPVRDVVSPAATR